MVGLGQSAAATLDRNEVVYLAQASSQRHNVRMFTEVGSRVSVHCTGVGKALPAQLSPGAARNIVDVTGMPVRTSHTIADFGRSGRMPRAGAARTS